jgi:hypothetical protein
MSRPLLFAILFAVIALVGFALVGPLLFPNENQKELGAKAFPFLLLGGAGLGYAIGKMGGKKK